MTAEVSHGRCRVCGFAPMFVRVGSAGWAEWEACPACGFAVVDDPYGGWPEEGPEVWESLARDQDPDHFRLLFYASVLAEPEFFDPDVSPSFPGLFLTNERMAQIAERHRQRIKKGEVRVFTPFDVTPEILEEARRIFNVPNAEKIARWLPHTAK